MDRKEWITRCSARLHAQWPRVQREQRDEVAEEIHRDDRWQALEPERAAAEWLSQGMPGDLGKGAAQAAQPGRG